MTNLNKKQKNIVKERLCILSIIIVQLIMFAVFYVYVNFRSIAMAFQFGDGKGNYVWSLKNFTDIYEDIFIKSSGELWPATLNTFKFFLLHQILFPISFITSYFLFKKVPGHKIFRIAFFLPSIISAVVWSNLYKEIIGLEGPIASLWQNVFHLSQPPRFLSTDKYALGAVMAYSVWFGIAGNFVLFSGTLTRIPNELIEVGALDGIKWYEELVKVIIPLVWPTVSTVWLLGLMGLFTSSGNILLLTNGNYNTMTLSHYLFTRVYNTPEKSNLLNYSSAIGLILTALTLPIVFLVQWLTGKVEKVEY